ncbi:MAG: carbohydrate kinase [Planctomycetes bacterium]|nr:carbohydrate kinase [Planctomycetota bacterium]
MARYLLGIDNGCTMSKAALFTLDGREVAVASRKTETLSPRPGHMERRVDELWKATAEAIREVLEKARAAPGDVACVACAGHGNGLYLVDEAGRPVRDAILSTDSRARDIVAAWLAAGIDKAVRPLTMQCVWAAQPNALLAWLKVHEPEVLRRTRWVLMCKDYVRFRLTGEIRAERTDFSGTSLLNVRTGDYDPRILEAFGLADLAGLMPPLVATADVCGQVTAAAAAETGLKAGTPVAGGMFDIDACALACGITDETQLCMIAGTWGNNQYISETPVVDDVYMTSCFSMPGYYLMLEGSATSASNLEWFVTEFFGAEREKAEREGRSVYDLCNDLVAATKPGDSGIVFLPFLFGSNANPDAKACLVGAGGWHTRGHVLRAIYEGVVFSHWWHVQRLLKFRKMPEVLRLTGGAARSRVWVQIFADVFQTPVQLPDGTELGALGAAIAAAVAAGVYPGYREAVDGMVRFARIQEPDPAAKALYEAKYAHYLKVIAALDPIWKDLQ